MHDHVVHANMVDVNVVHAHMVDVNVVHAHMADANVVDAHVVDANVFIGQKYLSSNQFSQAALIAVISMMIFTII